MRHTPAADTRRPRRTIVPRIERSSLSLQISASSCGLTGEDTWGPTAKDERSECSRALCHQLEEATAREGDSSRNRSRARELASPTSVSLSAAAKVSGINELMYLGGIETVRRALAPKKCVRRCSTWRASATRRAAPVARRRLLHRLHRHCCHYRKSRLTSPSDSADLSVRL